MAKSECEQFSVTVKDVKKTVDDVKAEAKKTGMTFAGDEKKGSFSGSGTTTFLDIAYSVDGEYTVSGNKISIKVKVEGIACFMATGKIKDWFK